jgi:hypothetical protein
MWRKLILINITQIRPDTSSQQAYLVAQIRPIHGLTWFGLISHQRDWIEPIIMHKPRLNKIIPCQKPSWLNGMLWRSADATSFGDGRGFCRASCVRCCVLEIGFGFNHKIIINVQESSPSIMVTRNLWSGRVWVRDWLCKGKTHHP